MNDDWMSIPADKMTLEQARNAVKVLRERYLEVVNINLDKEADIMDLLTKLKNNKPLEIGSEMSCKYKLPCGICELMSKGNNYEFCNIE